MPKFGGMDVDLSRFRVLGVELHVVDHPGSLSTLHLTLQAPDRDTGRLSRVANQYTMDVDALRGMRDARYVKECIRDFVIDCVIHEVEESLLIDGERLFDPHEGEEGYVAEPVKPLPSLDVNVGKLGSRYW